MPPTSGTGSRKPNIARLGHRLDDVGDGHERRGEPGAASREDAERHAHRDGDRGRDGHEQHVLADQRGQLLLMREPEADDVGHGRRSSRLDRGATVTASTNCRTRGSSALKDGARRAGPDQAARVEDADAIGQCNRFGHVVRDQEHRLAQPRLDAAELVLQLAARDRVERAERLVHQQDRRIRGEGARDADALALSARQLIGPARGVVVVREPDQPEQFADARAHALVLPAFEPRHHGDVVGDGQVRKEPDVLNDVAHGPSQADHIPFARVSALHAHLARLGQQQSIDQLEDRGLAGAARPDERHGLTGIDSQRESVQNGRLAGEPERHLAEFDPVHRRRQYSANASSG